MNFGLKLGFDGLRKQIFRGKDRGDVELGVWDGQVHTALFKMDSQQGPTVQNRELCSEESLGENGYMYMYG